MNKIESGKYVVLLQIERMKRSSGFHLGFAALPKNEQITIGDRIGKTSNMYYSLARSGSVKTKTKQWCREEVGYRLMPASIPDVTEELKEGDLIMMSLNVERKELSFVVNGSKPKKPLKIRTSKNGYCVFIGMIEEGDGIKIVDSEWSPRY